MRTRCIIICDQSGSTISFPHYLIKDTILEKKSLNTKCVFWFSLQLLSEIFFILRRNERDMIINVYRSSCKVKGKGLPRQAEVAQGVPVRLRPRIFLTFRHHKGGRSSAKRTGRLHPRRNPWYLFSEAESASGHMVLLGAPRKKSPVTTPGIDLGTVRLIAQRFV